MGAAYPSAERVIKARLNVPCVVNGVAVGHDEQEITISADGTWSANFYRQASCSQDKGPGDPTVAQADIFYYLTFPSGAVKRKKLPNEATKAYSLLEDYTGTVY